MRRFAEDEYSQIIEYYKDHTVTDTSLHFHRNLDTIKKVLKDNNVELHTKEYNTFLKNKKFKQTCLVKYGCESSNSADIVKKHKEESILKKYSVKNISQLEEVKKKKEQTCLDHFGVKNPGQVEEIKNKMARTCLEKYGETNPNKTREVQEKVLNTKLTRYGCIPIGQRYKYNNIYFHSFPEICVYLYCITKGIPIEREPLQLEFYCNNKKHFYVPDFKIRNELVEIKGNQFLSEDGTWICPFNKTEEGIALTKAKYRCAIENKVKILYKDDYQKYINWFYKNGYKREDFIV